MTGSKSDAPATHTSPKRQRRKQRYPSLAFRASVAVALLGCFALPTLAAAPVADAPVKTAPPAAKKPVSGEADVAVERRLSAAARFLSSDELEGRGIGTRGLETAAKFVADGFRAAGLQTSSVNGSFFQEFPVTSASTLGEGNTLAWVGSPPHGGKQQTVELRYGKDFTPLAVGGSAKFDRPLVFVGYGITTTGDRPAYDDYAGIDVKGKIVIVLRHAPWPSTSQDNPAGDPLHDTFTRKLSNAYQHGAAGVIFTTDKAAIDEEVAQFERRRKVAVEEIAAAEAKVKAIKAPTAEQRKSFKREIDELTARLREYEKQLEAARDPLLEFDRVSPESGGRDDFPVLYCRRGALAKVFEMSLGTRLQDLEAKIAKGPTPQSRELGNWRAVGRTRVKRRAVEIKNVVGVLPGEGPKAREAVVLGAHYDHLGMGDTNSLAPGVHAVHNGADDNASGVAVMLEVARRLAARPKKLPRTVVFVAFTGEERGLLGSARYCKTPAVPLEDTIAMLNLDMVGRLKDNKLIAHGTGTAPGFAELADRLAQEHGFTLTKSPGGFGPSDHASFYARKIPVLFFFTGSHEDYHRPTDDYEKLNVPGMRRIADVVTEATEQVASLAERPKYLETSAPAALARTGSRPYFGSIPDFSEAQGGYALSGVSKNSPAARAGLRGGDVIVGLGQNKIGNLEDFDGALRKYKAGDRVVVHLKRGAQQLELPVVLDPPR